MTHRSPLVGIVIVSVISVCLQIVFASGCASNQESDDNSGACIPMGHYPDPSEWPFFSQCLEYSKEDELSPCSEESALVSWDGERVFVRHECIPGQCGWKFEHEFVLDDGAITLMERDTATEAAGCDCTFRGAFQADIDAGNYEFRIKVDASAWGGAVETRLSEPIELGASESTEYCFRIPH